MPNKFFFLLTESIKWALMAGLLLLLPIEVTQVEWIGAAVVAILTILAHYGLGCYADRQCSY